VAAHVCRCVSGMVPRSLAFALVSIFSALALAVPAQAIVGGQVSGGNTATSYPWQVAITTTMDNEDWFCGGTRVASDLVLTAAHCVIDDDGRIAVPSHVTVFSGSTVLSNTTFSRATAVALFPGLDLQATPNGTPSGDLALVRIPSSAPGSPVGVVDASEAALWDVGAQLRITGWGYTSTNPANTTGYDVQSSLNWANVNRLSDDACTSAYGADFVGATMFCARGTTGADTCLGDSGGPIAYRMGTTGQLDNPSVWRLVGVTSWGTGCGNASFPGVYARLGDPALRAFATDPDPVWSPVNVTAPTMPSSATVGDVVTCAPGTWTGDDLVFSYEFHRRQADGSTVVVQSSTSSTYTVAAGDTPGLSCVELARNAGGTAWASSSSTPVTPAAVPTTQIPSPDTPRVPAPPATTPPIGFSGQASTTDGVSPRLSRATVRCASRRCTVSLRVTDPAPSSGVRRVTGTVTWKQSCRKHARRTTCAKSARVTGTKGSGTTWTLRLPRLPRGSASVAVIAIDGSGRIGTARKLTFRVR
jgi:trypsin